ncbi:hypothetical protein Dimus_008362 [Dionaea muscipula]
MDDGGGRPRVMMREEDRRWRSVAGAKRDRRKKIVGHCSPMGVYRAWIMATIGLLLGVPVGDLLGYRGVHRKKMHSHSDWALKKVSGNVWPAFFPQVEAIYGAPNVCSIFAMINDQHLLPDEVSTMNVCLAVVHHQLSDDDAVEPMKKTYVSSWSYKAA